MRFLVVEGGYHGGKGFTAEGCDLLRAQGRVDLVSVVGQSPEEALVQLGEFLPEADGVLFSPWYIPPTLPEHWLQARKLRVLGGTFDNRFSGWLDFQAVMARAVAIIDTSRSMTPSVAEFALAMTLNLIRSIPEAMELVRNGTWKSSSWDKPGFVFGDLAGRHVGLAGFGSINRRYAELLTPFHCSILAYDPFVGEQALSRSGVQRCLSLEELAMNSEIFVIGIPPTPGTQQIINAEILAALPKGALVILVTRMAVVDQNALWQRVQAEEIRVAVDVFAPEPPPTDAWFRQHPNVLPTPHVAGDAVYCHRRCFTDACRDAITVLSGGQPRFCATAWDDNFYQGRV